MMRIAVLAALTILAACGGAPDREAAETTTETAVAEPVPVPEPMPDLPPPPRYVGRWAASADMCMDGWWRFWSDEVRTKGEMRCDILPGDAADGDELRRTVCQAEGEWLREEWAFTYPDETTMTVKRGDAAPVTLIKC